MVSRSMAKNRLSPEVAYVYNQFGIAAQTYYGEQTFLPSSSAPLAVPVQETGFYVMSSFILTGESRTTYSQAVVPFNNFDARHPFANPGAWEVIARISSLRYGDSIFDSYDVTTKSGKKTTTIVYGPLANPVGNSQEATEFDIGFNWFLNKYIRVQFAYEHDMFLQPVQLGTGPSGLLNHQDSVITRLQLQF